MANHTREQHLEMMRSPCRWPIWPLLPLMNVNEPAPSNERLGFLFEAEGKVEPLVIVENFFYASGKSMRGLRKAKFDCFEEVYDAGWRVD